MVNSLPFGGYLFPAWVVIFLHLGFKLAFYPSGAILSLDLCLVASASFSVTDVDCTYKNPS
jgi:hypothetical protein